jgi:hypothetical protein
MLLLGSKSAKSQKAILHQLCAYGGQESASFPATCTAGKRLEFIPS